MISLAQAIETTNARKQAASGHDDDEPHIIEASEEQDRLIFSGLDVEYEEVGTYARMAGNVFGQLVYMVPLPAAISAAWTEGLLIGLVAAQQVREDEFE